MHRLTGRVLLTLMLVGTLAPVGLAVSAPAPHACCMRKPMHDRGLPGAEFHSPASHCQHDCCHALTVSQFPHLVPTVRRQVVTFSAPLSLERGTGNRSSRIQISRMGRAPPLFSIA